MRMYAYACDSETVSYRRSKRDRIGAVNEPNDTASIDIEIAHPTASRERERERDISACDIHD